MVSGSSSYYNFCLSKRATCFVISSPARLDFYIACGMIKPSKIGTHDVRECPASTTRPVVEPVENNDKVAEFMKRIEYIFNSSKS
jgi:hypothetical protein